MKKWNPWNGLQNVAMRPLLMSKQEPPLKQLDGKRIEYIIFIPIFKTRNHRLPPNLHLINSRQVFGALSSAAEYT